MMEYFTARGSKVINNQETFRIFNQIFPFLLPADYVNLQPDAVTTTLILQILMT